MWIAETGWALACFFVATIGLGLILYSRLCRPKREDDPGIVGVVFLAAFGAVGIGLSGLAVKHWVHPPPDELEPTLEHVLLVPGSSFDTRIDEAAVSPNDDKTIVRVEVPITREALGVSHMPEELRVIVAMPPVLDDEWQFGIPSMYGSKASVGFFSCSPEDRIVDLFLDGLEDEDHELKLIVGLREGVERLRPPHVVEEQIREDMIVIVRDAP